MFSLQIQTVGKKSLSVSEKSSLILIIFFRKLSEAKMNNTFRKTNKNNLLFMHNKPYQGPNNPWDNQQAPLGFPTGSFYGKGYEQPVPYIKSRENPVQPAQLPIQPIPPQLNPMKPYVQIKHIESHLEDCSFQKNEVLKKQKHHHHHKKQPQELPKCWGHIEMNQYGKEKAVENRPVAHIKQEQILVKLVDDIFIKYDLNKSGNLNMKEIPPAFNQLLKKLSLPIVLSKEQAIALLFQIDVNFDGRINRQEMLKCIKNLVINEALKPSST